MENLEEITTEEFSEKPLEDQSQSEALLEQEVDEVSLNALDMEPDTSKKEQENEKQTFTTNIISPNILKEPVASNDLKVELSFVLGRQLVPLDQLKSLIEGKVIPLGGAQFEASILLQEKIIAIAALVLVDGVPSLQITKEVTV